MAFVPTKYRHVFSTPHLMVWSEACADGGRINILFCIPTLIERIIAHADRYNRTGPIDFDSRYQNPRDIQTMSYSKNKACFFLHVCENRVSHHLTIAELQLTLPLLESNEVEVDVVK